ncbi:MAG: two-component system, OmpR family, phosphate regulon sensor histidine kinase PhoR, partial [Candidatus Poribacteria bacterium]|nr:two-component system, OmpR family, phosphate regulon sensor histidine kinase PhoR [Candidatus Poribacteria bacterium]
LDFSKIENGKMGFHYKQESINEVILYAVGIFQAQLAENDCDITINLADNLPQLQIDKDIISEALLNLLSNAVKYSLEDKRVTINTQIVNNHVAIEVVDNGIGIPQHHQKKIFEPFYRVNDSLSKDTEGTGLGLAYVKYIAEAHGGKVTVQSEVGHGSKITLLIPYPKKGRQIDTNSDS